MTLIYACCGGGLVLAAWGVRFPFMLEEAGMLDMKGCFAWERGSSGCLGIFYSRYAETNR